MVLRAEELLDRLMEVAPNAAAYNLIGNLAVVQQDHLRAELAYQEAMSKDPGNPEITLNLASLYLAQGGYAKARATLAPVLERFPELARAREVERSASARASSRSWPARAATGAGGCRGRSRRSPPSRCAASRPGRPRPAGARPAASCTASPAPSPHAQEGQLLCPACGGRLRLADDALKYLFLRYLEP